MFRKGGTMRLAAIVFVTVCALMLFYDAVAGNKLIAKTISQLFLALRPVFYGGVIAYILAPLISGIEATLFKRRVEKAKAKGKLFSRRARAASLILTWVFVTGLVYLAVLILIPSLYESVRVLMANAEGYYRTISGWIEEMLDANPDISEWVAGQLDSFYAKLLKFDQKEILPRTQALITALGGGVLSTLVFLKNLLIGIIVSFYFLATKERTQVNMKKIIFAVFQNNQIPLLFRGLNRMNRIFSGFLRGKLLDSVIIAGITLVFGYFAKMPYVSLVAMIIGITNMIPFFGPFLGAIPCTFLILLVDPFKALTFVIFVLILQQIDGNVIGPKILGDSTGLSGLWVIIAILVGGSFYGVAGMFFGVPVFASLYSLGTYLVEQRLRMKNLPESDRSYRPGRIPYVEPEEAPESER